MRFRLGTRQLRVLLAAGVSLVLAAPAAAAEGHFLRSLTVTGPVSLHIRTGSGNIHVSAGNVSSVTIEGKIQAHSIFGNPAEQVRRLEADPPIQQMGNIIRIGEIRDPELQRNVSISYEVTTPAETYLDSHTGSGDQRVEGVRRGVNVTAGSGNLFLEDLAGRLDGETGSGDIDVRGVQGRVTLKAGSGNIRAGGIAGRFWGHAGSGDVTVEQTAAEEVEVETGSGNVQVSGARKALKVTTGSGDVRLEGQVGDAWSASTGSGNVVLHLTSGFELQARTSSGDVHVDRTMETSVSNRHETRGRVSGGGPPVQITTGSGDIRVE